MRDADRCTDVTICVVNCRVAQTFVEDLLPMRLPYDHVLDRGWHFGPTVRAATETPCIQDDRIASMTGCSSAPKRRLRATRTLPATAHRGSNEGRRIVCGLGEQLRDRFAD